MLPFRYQPLPKKQKQVQIRVEHDQSLKLGEKYRPLRVIPTKFRVKPSIMKAEQTHKQSHKRVFLMRVYVSVLTSESADHGSKTTIGLHYSLRSCAVPQPRTSLRDTFPPSQR